MAELSTVLSAPAKINLALAVSGRRVDGFHNIETVFQSISLSDRVEVVLKDRGIVCNCGELSGENNLAFKAAGFFLNKYKNIISCSHGGAEITIEKNIPIQAGLAGGSSDAAAVLRALNILLACPFSYEELLELADECGSDTAFCLKGGTQWGEGTGSDLSELPSAPDMDLIVVRPSRGINTAEAYCAFDGDGEYTRLDKNQWIEMLNNKDTERIGENLSNSLERIACKMVPEIRELKNILQTNGCSSTLMSGSGSAVFGILRDREHGDKIRKVLASAGFQNTWVVKTMNYQSVNFLN